METREWTLEELHQQLDACYRAASSEYVGMSIPRYLAVALLNLLEHLDADDYEYGLVVREVQS